MVFQNHGANYFSFRAMILPCHKYSYWDLWQSNFGKFVYPFTVTIFPQLSVAVPVTHGLPNLHVTRVNLSFPSIEKYGKHYIIPFRFPF